VSNLTARSCKSEVCCHLGSISLNKSEVAKNVHAAAIDKTKHAIAAAVIYPYKPNTISDEDFEPSESTRKDEMPDENLEGTEDGHSNVDSPPHVDGPDLPIPASTNT
jgi:hypothetical protein